MWVVVLLKEGDFVGWVVIEEGLMFDVCVLVGFVVEGKCVGCVGYLIVFFESVYVVGVVILGVLLLILGVFVLFVYVDFEFVVIGIVLYLDVCGMCVLVFVVFLFFYLRRK